MSKKTNRTILGKLGSSYGLKGWLKITSHTEPVTNILDYPVWHIKHKNEWIKRKVEAGKPHGKIVVAKLEGIETPEEAKLYTNDLIAVETLELPALQEGEYYWSDLIGLTAQTQDGTILGDVIEMLETGANDVIVIQADKRILIPYIKEAVIEIDLKAKQIVINDDFI